MRVLVVGAGAIGGYFGGRLLVAGCDVTFLVRPRRAAELARTGLVIRSKFGDIDLSAPPMVTADTLREPFDIVLLSCKAYDLDDAMAAFAPAVGPQTVILPLLNGIRHLDALEARFGANHVLGGQCQISAVLDPNGQIVHLSDSHSLSFGERDGLRSARVEAVAAGDVGEVGVHRDWGRDHLPDARDRRRYCGSRRRRPRHGSLGRMRRDRRPRRFSA